MQMEANMMDHLLMITDRDMVPTILPLEVNIRENLLKDLAMGMGYMSITMD